MRRDEALATLRALLPALRERYGVVSVALFGSVARDEAGPDSDVDVMIEVDRPIGYFELAGIGIAMSEACGRKVDVELRGEPSSRFMQHIVRDLVVV